MPFFRSLFSRFSFDFFSLRRKSKSTSENQNHPGYFKAFARPNSRQSCREALAFSP
jgi:hypothetical protein